MKYDIYKRYVDFIDKYKKASNASSGSEVDANANVENKNIATMQGELPKKDLIGTNRLLMWNKISEMFGEEMADEYIRQLDKAINTNVTATVNAQKAIINFYNITSWTQFENVINQKNGNIYNLTVDIAKTADGRTILYATDGKIKKVTLIEPSVVALSRAKLNVSRCVDDSVCIETLNLSIHFNYILFIINFQDKLEQNLKFFVNKRQKRHFRQNCHFSKPKLYGII